MATFETKHTHASAADLLHIRIGTLDWNESYEKKTKYIHASATDLLHIKIGNLDWSMMIGANADIAKTKREK